MPRWPSTTRDQRSLRLAKYHTWEVLTRPVHCATRKGPGQLSLRGRHAHHGHGHVNLGHGRWPDRDVGLTVCDRLLVIAS